MEQLLALGTVVKAVVGPKQTARLMIIGYYPRNHQDGQVYDYATVLYPMGMSMAPAMQCINKNVILAVEKAGYLDEEAAQFTKGLPELLRTTSDVILDVLKEEAQKTDAAQAEEQGGTADEEKTKKDMDFLV